MRDEGGGEEGIVSWRLMFLHNECSEILVETACRTQTFR